MSLQAQFGLARGELQLAVAFEVAAGETLALLGPNGAGKSTCLQAIAGLVPLGNGRIALGGDVLDELTGEARTVVAMPPEKRGIGYLPQEPLLFPHMSVRDNVAFGLRAQGRDRRSARAVADQWLRRGELADLANVRPRALSGGQAQRVSLLRALAAGPRCLLLDEPLAAVDASASLALRQLLAAHLAAFAGPRIVVTHDPVSAFVLADRIAVLEAGRIVQVGTPAEIGRQPRSRYAADLVGLNFVRGVVHDSVLRLANGAQLVVAVRHEGPAIATVHPRAIALYRERPAGSPRNVWQAEVVAVEPSLERVRVRTGGDLPLVAEITPAAQKDLSVAVGSLLWVTLKATEITVEPA